MKVSREQLMEALQELGVECAPNGLDHAGGCIAIVLVAMELGLEKEVEAMGQQIIGMAKFKRYFEEVRHATNVEVAAIRAAARRN